jgi:heavy metal sensor kinase
VIRFYPKHVRTRLTLWYVLVLASLLLLACVGTGFLLFWQMRTALTHYAIQDIETIEGLLSFGADGQIVMRVDYHNHPESKQVLERFLEVLSPDGTILFRNERLGSLLLGGNPFPDEGVGGYSARSERLGDGTLVRVVSRRHSLDRHPILIRLAYSEDSIWSQMRELLIAALLVLPVMLAAAGLAGYGLARRALAPLEVMARRADEITPQLLHERLPTGDADDELGNLARVFNNLLARLEQSFEQLRRFTSDASHELRTPLASIRSVGEVGLQKDGSREDYRDIIGSMLEEVNRLTSLIDNLLTIARADAGSLHLQLVEVCVMELAREAAGLFEVLSEEKSLTLIFAGDESAAIQGDRLFLRQALVNLLHNAVKYSPECGTISVRVRSTETEVIVEIEDGGPGVPLEDRPRIFDRFYRVDKARWRESGGAGLGLSITKWVVEAHSGKIGLESASERGCLFWIRLPLSRS